jgi:hypothetical protein
MDAKNVDINEVRSWTPDWNAYFGFRTKLSVHPLARTNLPEDKGCHRSPKTAHQRTP